MTDTYKQLKNELSVLYPDTTDSELNEITYNLIDFYTIAVKTFLRNENIEVESTNILKNQ